VARNLAELKHDKIIEWRGKVLLIDDQKKLQDIALEGKQT